MTAGRQITEERVLALTGEPLGALVALIDSPRDELVEIKGAKYRVRTYAFWDAEPEVSDLLVRVKTTGKGLRALERYYGVETRDPDESEPQPREEAQVSHTAVETGAWAGCLGLLLAFLILAVVGAVTAANWIF